jgi:hypothetical protein
MQNHSLSKKKGHSTMTSSLTKPFFYSFIFTIAFIPCLCTQAAFSQTRKDIDIIDRTRAGEVIHGEKQDIPLLNQATEEQMDKGYEQISETVISAATWLDSFFDDNRYTAEENKTRAKLRLMAGIEQDGSFEFKPRVSVRLHLPGAKDRLNLLISANDDEDFDVDRSNSLNSRDKESDLTGSLQFFLKQTEKLNISTSLGLSTSYAYAGLRYRGFYDYGSWQGRFTSRLRYYSDDGLESRNQYDIERQVSEKLLFRTTLEANWEEEQNGVPHAITFSLFQVLKLDRAIMYDIGNYFDTRPNDHMADMVFRMRYRQRFYRDWLVVEVAPQISFPQEYDREFTPGIIVKLEAEFGYTSYKRQFDNIFTF